MQPTNTKNSQKRVVKYDVILGDHVKTAHGIPARIERILTNSRFDNARTTSVALNPSWMLYSASRRLVQIDRQEKGLSQGDTSSATPRAQVAERGGRAQDASASKRASQGSSKLAAGASRKTARGGEGWQQPPPPGQHPFSDIIWFS